MTLIKFGTFISKITGAIIQFLAWFKRPECLMTTPECAKIKSLLQNGDSLFSRTEWELTNPLMPGYWKHTAIYLNGWVYQAVTAGVNKISIEEFVYKKDYVGIGRVKTQITQAQCDAMQAFCEQQLGDGYDYDLLWGLLKTWYCAKLTYWAYQTANPTLVSTVPSFTILGIEHISPMDMWESVNPVATYNVPSGSL